MKILVYILSFTCFAGIACIGYAQAPNDTLNNVVNRNKLNADTIYWKKSFSFGLNFNQASFSENWTGGGVNSYSIGSVLQGSLTRKYKKFLWENDLQLMYGVLKNKNQSLRKNADLIFFDTRLGYNLSKTWDVFGAVNLISQFAEGFSYANNTQGVEVATRISNFFSPAYITESFGLKYEPVPYFWARLGAIAFRQTFVIDTTLYKSISGNYGVPIGDQMVNQFGYQIIAELNKDIAKNLNLKARYLAFGPYEKMSLDNTYHRMDINISAKITKFVATSLQLTGLYDKTQDTDLQWSQVLALGISYKYK